MSVTFSIESLATGAFTAECYNEGNGPVVLGPVEGYEAIVPVLVAHKAECDECAAYGIYSQAVCDVDDALDVNVANVNARVLLVALGLGESDEGDLSGMVEGADFLGRVLLAMATDRDDSGVRDVETVGANGARWIDCGLPADYFAERFGALHALGQEATRLGRSVVWS